MPDARISEWISLVKEYKTKHVVGDRVSYFAHQQWVEGVVIEIHSDGLFYNCQEDDGTISQVIYPSRSNVRS
jgi:hypothetical protein